VAHRWRNLFPLLSFAVLPSVRDARFCLRFRLPFFFVYRLLVACAVLFCAASRGAAQDTCRLRLVVLLQEEHTSAPVFPADVTTTPGGAHLHPDEGGRATVDSFCPGLVMVDVEAPGFLPQTIALNLTADTVLVVRVAHGRELQAVEVSSVARAAAPLQSATTVENIDAMAGRPVADMLATVTGVTTFSNGATIGKPVIHGLYGARVLTLAAGLRQEDQQWGAEHALALDPLALEDVRVVRGAAGVRYGVEAIGGAVVMEPASLRATTGTDAVVRLGAFSNNRMSALSGRIDHRPKAAPRLAFRVQGSGRLGGNYRLPGGQYAANTGVREGAGSFLARWRGAHNSVEAYYSFFGTQLGIYRGSHTGNEADLQAAIASPDPLWPADFTYALRTPRQTITHHTAKLQGAQDTRFGRITATYGFQHNTRLEYDVTRIPTDRAQLNLTLATQTLNLSLDHRRVGRFSGSVGAEGQYAQNRFADGDRVFLPFYDLAGVSAFAIERVRWNGWTAEAGARWDLRHYNVKNPEGPAQGVVEYVRRFSNPSGTIGARRAFARGRGEAGMTLSAAWRAPQPAELFAQGYHQSAARIERGQKDLAAEQSLGVNADFSYEWDSKLRVEATLYHQRIRDFIYLNPGPSLLTIRGAFRTFDYAQTDVALSGADLGVRWTPIVGLDVSAGAALLRARDVSQREPLIGMPPDRYNLSVRYGADWGILRRAFAAAAVRYSPRQTRVPRDFDSRDVLRPPAGAAILSAEVGSEMVVGGQPLSWSVSVSNLLNTRYREYLDAFRYFLDRPGRELALRVTVPISFNSAQSN